MVAEPYFIMSSNIKNPPLLEKSTSYDSWKLSLQMWQVVTDLKVEQQGPAVFLSLTDKAKDAVSELGIEVIKTADGVNKILEKLEKIYKKDSVDAAYDAFEAFINYKRESGTKISHFITEFERLYSKAKPHGCELSDGILGYFLLNQANLSTDHNKLVRATISKLDLIEVKTKMLKVFGSSELSVQEPESLNIKVEDLNLSEKEQPSEDVLYGQVRYGGGSGRGAYARGRYYAQGNQFQNRGSRGGGSGLGNLARGKSMATSSNRKAVKMRCYICESVMHFAAECPHRTYLCEEEEIEDSHEITLYQSNLVTQREYNIFVAEASDSAILDCGASSTVAGKLWFDSYCQGLSDVKQNSIKISESKSIFKFGSGERFASLFRAVIPATIGNNEIFITTDVVNSSIPLLLSKEAMKRANTEIDFMADTVKMFGQKQSVYSTKSGHYSGQYSKI